MEDGPFHRLHLLVRHGYVAKLDYGGVEDAIFLDHLAAGPDLILYPDGKVVSLRKGEPINFDPGADRDRIYCDDAADANAFRRFLASLPKPTWRQRTAPARERYIYTPGCTVIFIGFLWGGMYLVVAAVKAFFRT